MTPNNTPARIGIADEAVALKAPEMERQVLGMMLLQPQLGKAVGLPLLTAADFAEPKLRTIFNAILGVTTSGAVADDIAVVHLLRESGTLQGVGGPHAVASLSMQSGNSSNLERYCRILNQHRAKRELYHLAHGLLQSLQQDDDVFDTLANARATQDAIETSFSRTSLRTLADVNRDAFYYLADRVNNPSQGRVAFGIPRLDEVTGGLEPGDTVVIGARPGMSKSDLMVHFARHNAALGLPGMVFSLEMTAMQVAFRFLAHPSGVPANVMRGKPDGGQMARLAHAAENMALAELIFIDERSGLTIPELRAAVAVAKAKCPTLAWVAVDYLQLAKGTGKSNLKSDEVEEVSQGLKEIAKEMKVVMLELSQLNREVDKLNPPVPVISHMRGSGQIEQDASLIIFPWRPSYYGLECDSNGELGTIPVVRGMVDTEYIEFIVAKNRNNPPGRAIGRYHPAVSRFSCYPQDAPAEWHGGIRTISSNDFE